MAATRRRQSPIFLTIAIVVVVLLLVSVATGIITEKFWYDSVGYGGVFSTLIWTKLAMFGVFGAIMAVVVGANIWVAHRFRPLFVPNTPDQVGLGRYRDVVQPLRRILLVAVSLLVGLFAGLSASGEWRTFLLWANAPSFGKTDPYFHEDAGFYMFSLPWWHFLVAYFTTALVIGLIATVLVQYLYAGIRLAGPSTQRFSGPAQVQVSVLVGLLLLLRGASYWLGRYDLVTGNGSLITGMTYARDHAELPARNILTFVAIICALLLFANVVRRTWLLPSVGVALLLLTSVLLGVIWPGIVQKFEVDPTPADKEAPYIAANIAATRSAYGVDHVSVTEYQAKSHLDNKQLLADSASLPGIRLIDPAIVSDAFEQLQQVRGYYKVPGVLDVDRYNINGSERDLVVAPREINLLGLPASQQNWTNEHTVYTHGYGMVAAFGNQRDADNNPVVNSDGTPAWAETNLPPRGQLTDLKPGGYKGQIYYGEQSPPYSIVGKTPGGPNVELDLPQGQGSSGTGSLTTYAGKGGVPVGSLLRKILYAIKFSDTNLVLSGRVNADSKILYDRNPRVEVQKVAPWLTVDSDPLPSVVNGRIVWILDGYTTSNQYPLSESRSLQDMTSDAYNPQSTFANLSSDHINYMRNAVKATVDAYDGTVTLYAWDTSDPILRAWEKIFPGTVKPRSAIPPDLLAHFRYPEDLFKVQRDILAQYHVTNPRTWYSGSDRWDVPEDPNAPTTKQPPYRLSVATKSGEKPVFSLTSVYSPYNRQNLASFMSVGADATKPSYGKFQVLRLPDNTQVPGPLQIANTFAADKRVASALYPFRQSGARAIPGNLLTLPVGGGLLYVEPLYTQRTNANGTYPQLRYVLVSFGNDVGIGTTLSEALTSLLGGPTVTGTPGGGTTSGPALSGSALHLLQQAQAKFRAADDALKSGDLQTYASDVQAAQSLVRQAVATSKKAGATKPSTKPTSSPSPKPSSSPSTTPSAKATPKH